MKEYFLIAKIVAPLGLDGFVKLKSYSDFPERFAELNKVYIDVFGDKRKFIVEDFLHDKAGYSIKFKNFDSSTEVSFLNGCDIYIEKNDLTDLDDDEFYIHDLIGCEVFEKQRYIGKIKDVMSLVSNDVFEVVTENGKELLIPFIDDYFDKYDNKKKVLFIKNFENMFDDEN